MIYRDYVYRMMVCFMPLIIGCGSLDSSVDEEKFFTSGNIAFQIDTSAFIDIEEGEIFSADVPFTYIGSKAAKVISVKSGGDCNCTKLNLSAEELLPGQNYSLTFDYDSRGQSEGFKETKIFLSYSEEEEEQVAILTLPFHIYRRIILDSQSIYLGAIGESTAIDKTIQIKIVGDYDCQKIKAFPSTDSLLAEIIPLSNDHTEGYVFVNLHITGTISPRDNRIYEQVFLTFPEFFGKEKNLNVRLYGTLEERVRIVPATLFLGYLEIGVKKAIGFMVLSSPDDNVEIADIRLDDDEKGVFTTSEIGIRDNNGMIGIVGLVTLTEGAIHDTSLTLNVVFLLNGERIEQELPCVYLVNKEKLP